MKAEQLAQILADEFARDSWGYIDPYLFKMVSKGIDPDDDSAENAEALKEVLDRVVKRIK